MGSRQRANEHKSAGNRGEADGHRRTGKSPWNVLQMIAALLFLKALAACGAGDGAVFLQPGLKSLVMRLILHKWNVDVHLLYLLLKRHLTFPGRLKISLPCKPATELCTVYTTAERKHNMQATSTINFVEWGCRSGQCRQRSRSLLPCSNEQPPAGRSSLLLSRHLIAECWMSGPKCCVQTV